jgi:uncharacterized membrane protein
MSQAGGRWSDQQVEQVVGNLLRAGVLTAALVVLAGGLVYLSRRATERAYDKYEVFQGEPADLRSPYGIVADALAGSGRGIIQFGILLLIATPVARVLFSAFAFFRQRDWTYVVVSLLVLSILLYSLLNSRL